MEVSALCFVFAVYFVVRVRAARDSSERLFSIQGEERSDSLSVHFETTRRCHALPLCLCASPCEVGNVFDKKSGLSQE